LTARWNAEKDKLGSEQKFKEQLEAARNELVKRNAAANISARANSLMGSFPISKESLPRPRRNAAAFSWTKQ